MKPLLELSEAGFAIVIQTDNFTIHEQGDAAACSVERCDDIGKLKILRLVVSTDQCYFAAAAEVGQYSQAIEFWFKNPISLIRRLVNQFTKRQFWFNRHTGRVEAGEKARNARNSFCHRCLWQMQMPRRSVLMMPLGGPEMSLLKDHG